MPVSLNPPIGKLALGVVTPVDDILCVNAVAMSDIVLLWVVLLIVVPVTTGFPDGKLYDPEPLRGIDFSYRLSTYEIKKPLMSANLVQK